MSRFTGMRRLLTATIVGICLTGCSSASGGFGFGGDSDFTIEDKHYPIAHSSNKVDYCVGGEYHGKKDVTIVLLRKPAKLDFEKVVGEGVSQSIKYSLEEGKYNETFYARYHNTFTDLESNYYFQVCGRRLQLRRRFGSWCGTRT